MEASMSDFNILTGKRTGQRPLERNWCRWEDNIINRYERNEFECEDSDLFD